MVGLMLYALDLPQKTRLSTEGEPGDAMLPSVALGKILKRSDAPDEVQMVRRTYFLLSDRYLHPETHKRIYLFGSLYRIFVDLRLMCGAAVVAGSALLLADSRARLTGSLVSSGLRELPSTVAALTALCVVGLLGDMIHRRNYNRRRALGDEDRQESYARARMVPALAEMAPVSLLIFLLGLFGTLGVLTRTAVGQLAGSVFGLLALVLWFWIEVGPPGDAKSDGGLRRQVLILLRASRVKRARVQYYVFERAMTDVALFAPWFFATEGLYGVQGRPRLLAAWAALALVSTLILATGKHERRLVESYGQQVAWLDLHAKDLQALDADGMLPDRWG